MPSGILLLWPERQRSEARALAAQAVRQAPERAPITVAIAGGDEPVALADARLDNAHELRNQLGISSTTSDGEILAEALSAWGTSFTDHLIGDFAWVSWDPGERELLLVRDHMGIRPLVYARYRDGFAAGTDVRCLRALPGVDLSEDDLFVAMYLTDLFLDCERTIYRGIRRVPPAHIMRVRHFGLSAHLRRYWELPKEDLELSAESQYLERFRDTFLDAVRSRLPPDGQVATELSGGLDSTVVTAAAAEEVAPQPVLSLAASFAGPRYAGSSADEGNYRTWTRTDPRLRLLELPAEKAITLRGVHRLLDSGGLPLAQVMELIRLQLWDTARAHGYSVILDGFDGDTAINYGFERLTGLLLRGRIGTLGRELQASFRVAGWRGLREAAVLMIYPSYHRIRSRFRLPHTIESSVASRRLLEDSGFIDRFRSLERVAPGDVRGDHVLELLSGDTALSIERCEFAAVAAGIEIRHPFFDRRLVELAVSLPSKFLFRNRMPRWIERQALTDFGPDFVLWRHDKGGMPPEMASEVLDLLGFRKAPIRLAEPIDAWLDHSALSSTWRSWTATRDIEAAYALYPAAVLSRWASRVHALHP